MFFDTKNLRFQNFTTFLARFYEICENESENGVGVYILDIKSSKYSETYIPGPV